MSSEEIIFDADRDNNGKGIPVEEIIDLLKTIKKEENQSNGIKKL